MNGFNAVLVRLSPEELEYVSRGSVVISKHRDETLKKWETDFSRYCSQGIDLVKESDIGKTREYVTVLFDAFIRYMGNKELNKYLSANVELGRKMAKENFAYETMVIAFHFFERAYYPILILDADVAKNLENVSMSLDALHHSTLAIIAREYFKEKNGEIDFMVSNLIHDIKNNLQVGYFIYEMLKRNADSERRKYAETLKDSMDDVMNMTVEALDLIKIRNGTYRLKLEPINVCETVHKVINPYMLTDHGRKIEIFINGEKCAEKTHGDGITLNADKKLLERALGNLVSNAVKYTKNKIDINLRDTGDSFLFEVNDNGKGIAREYVDKIFEQGFQIEGTQKKYSSGIGLSSFKKIVELHNGKTWVESKLGEGTAFYFTLPKQGSMVS